MKSTYLLAAALLLAAPLASRAQGVGIGTTTPATRLEVAGTLSPTAVGTEGLLRLTRPDNSGIKYANTAEWQLGTYESSATTTQSRSRLDLRLGNGASSAPDATVLTVQGNGRVGIGTTTPAQALDVAGSVQVAGNVQVPAASAYTYAAPKAYSLTLGVADFHPRTSTDGKSVTIVGTNEQINPTVAGGSLQAPLHLPTGAVITGFFAYGYDGVADDLTVVLKRQNTGALQVSTLGSFTSSGAPGLTSGTVSLAVTTNPQDGYFVQADFPTATPALALFYVRVSYTVTQVE